jgi:Tol biopolymer transport system component
MFFQVAKRLFFLLAMLPFAAQDGAAQEGKAKLLITFASYRDRPKYPHIFFYEHDGVASGKITGTVTSPRSQASAEAHPWLTQDAKFCAFTYELENKTSKIHFWDMAEKKLIDLPKINDSPNAVLSPSMSADGNLICFAALSRPMGAGLGYHVYLYDRAAKKLIDLPGLNTPKTEERMPKISADGRWIVFVSNRKEGAGLSDIYLYDRKEAKLVDLPGLNSPFTDVEPSVSGDGNLIAFASDRPGGKGSRDVYLYDRAARKLVNLPGLNSAGPEYTPCLSADGAYIVFVSERIGGEGERDIFLYDRKAGKLLPTPGLNSKAEDFDPSIIVLKAG